MTTTIIKQPSKIIFIAILLFTASCNSKIEKDKETYVEIVDQPVINTIIYDNIGFACNEGGSPTDLVNEFSKLIKEKKYGQIRSKLYDSNPSIIFLSTFSCEKLEMENIIKLNSEEKIRIKINKNNFDTISTCSGCTNFEKFTVNELLTDTTNYLNIEAIRWFDYLLGKN